MDMANLYFLYERIGWGVGVCVGKGNDGKISRALIGLQRLLQPWASGFTGGQGVSQVFSSMGSALGLASHLTCFIEIPSIHLTWSSAHHTASDFITAFQQRWYLRLRRAQWPGHTAISGRMGIQTQVCLTPNQKS